MVLRRNLVFFPKLFSVVCFYQLLATMEKRSKKLLTVKFTADSVLYAIDKTKARISELCNETEFE